MPAPISPLDTTFTVLTANSSPDVEVMLMAAAQSTQGEVAQRAVRAIVARPGQMRLAELVRRTSELSEAACDELARHSERLATPLKQSLSHPDVNARIAGLEFVRRSANYSQFKAVLSMAQHADNPARQNAADTVRDLLELLLRRVTGSDKKALPHLKNVDVLKLQQDLLNELDEHAERFERLADPQLVIESILLLGDIDSPVVRKTLDKRGSPCRDAAIAMLTTSTHPRLIGLILQTLTRELPHPKLRDVFASRTDLEFISELLTQLPDPITGPLAENLKQIGALPWLSVEHEVWGQIRPELHAKLVALINALGLERATKKDLKRWFLQNSRAEGRQAASDILFDLPEDEVQEALYEGLASDDPKIEAWATRQLRSQQLPDTFKQLLNRLDATENMVRDAAREELGDFNLERLWALLPQLSSATCQRCGDILQKINPETIEQLRLEMQHAFRWRRLRAVRAAAVLGLADELLPTLVSLSEDEDTMVRRTAVEALAASRSREAVAAIQRRLDDSNRSVRATAENALEVMNSSEIVRHFL